MTACTCAKGRWDPACPVHPPTQPTAEDVGKPDKETERSEPNGK